MLVHSAEQFTGFRSGHTESNQFPHDAQISFAEYVREGIQNLRANRFARVREMVGFALRPGVHEPDRIDFMSEHFRTEDEMQAAQTAANHQSGDIHSFSPEVRGAD